DHDLIAAVVKEDRSRNRFARGGLHGTAAYAAQRLRKLRSRNLEPGPSKAHRIAPDRRPAVPAVRFGDIPDRPRLSFAAGIQDVESVAAEIARLHAGSLASAVHDRIELFLFERLSACHNGISKPPSHLRCATESRLRILTEG